MWCRKERRCGGKSLLVQGLLSVERCFGGVKKAGRFKSARSASSRLLRSRAGICSWLRRAAIRGEVVGEEVAS